MEKYLSSYAEPETAALASLPDNTGWSQVVTIPACNETAEFLRRPPPSEARSLMILVINEPEGAANEVSDANRCLAAAVTMRFEQYWKCAATHDLKLFRDIQSSRDVLVVDRFSGGRQLPVKGGVGHARKIAADLAASLIQRGRIGSSWIHCTDADAHLPDQYFTTSSLIAGRSASPPAALIYPFQHRDDLRLVTGGRSTGLGPDSEAGQGDIQQIALATQLYELSLRYYVAGMKFAHSPYAFHTIGSTMALDATHYAKVRGFPKRQAGEDFYVLNKLAKVGKVFEIGRDSNCEPIRLESRRSDRVPFGTGAAVNKITSLQHPQRDFLFYHPAVFVLLRRWLECLPTMWEERSTNLGAALSSASQSSPVSGTAAGNLPGNRTLLEWLRINKADDALSHAFRHSEDFAQFTRQIHTWFDSFRTLKLVHYLREHQLPSINHRALKESEVFLELLERDPELLSFSNSLQQKLNQITTPAN